jgi:type IV secretory pathway TrbD component
MQRERTLTDRLGDEILHARTLDQVSLLRNVCLGGAAACLVILTGLLQVSDKSGVAFSAATWLVALSLPLWILSSSTYEGYILLGERSFGHLNMPATRKLLVALFGTAGFALWGAVGSLIGVLEEGAVIGYIVISVLMVIAGFKANKSLATWLFSENVTRSAQDV